MCDTLGLNMDRVTNNFRGFKEPVTVYVYPDVYRRIEEERGLVKRSTYVEMLLEEVLGIERDTSEGQFNGIYQER